MGRHRSRSRSDSPRRRTPPRSSSRKHYDEPRYRHRSDRRSPPSSGLLVRNVALDTRPEELRIPFEKFGPVKDVYLPRNYYTREPRGFGFVKFRYPEDAAKALDRLNHTVIGGREIRIVYAEENRRTSRDLRRTGHSSGRHEGRRRTPTRSPRRRYHSYSRSPVTRRRVSRSVSRSPAHRVDRGHSSSRSRSPLSEKDRSSRSESPRGERDYRSTRRSVSPRKGSHSDKRDYKKGVSSPCDEDYQSSKRSRRSREISPDEEMPSRSSKRSVSPRKYSPLRDDSPSDVRESRKVRSPNPRDIKSHDENNSKSSKKPLGPGELSPHDEEYHKTGSRNISVSDGEGLWSSERSVNPQEDSIPGGDCKSQLKLHTSREVLARIDE